MSFISYCIVCIAKCVWGGYCIENKTDMYSLMKKEQVRHCEEMGSEVVVAVHWECRQSSLLCVYVCVILD